MTTTSDLARRMELSGQIECLRSCIETAIIKLNEGRGHLALVDLEGALRTDDATLRKGFALDKGIAFSVGDYAELVFSHNGQLVEVWRK
jgi:hypothetical protein